MSRSIKDMMKFKNNSVTPNVPNTDPLKLDNPDIPVMNSNSESTTDKFPKLQDMYNSTMSIKNAHNGNGYALDIATVTDNEPYNLEGYISVNKRRRMDPTYKDFEVLPHDRNNGGGSQEYYKVPDTIDIKRYSNVGMVNSMKNNLLYKNKFKM